jgi:hypothetical protein
VNKVFAHMTMSLDGYIADLDDQVGELFEWYSAGDVPVPSTSPDIQPVVDITNGWDDNHPAGAPVVVVTP